ncbi:MAG: hypothetical protein PF904_17045 [Kiritimatiellae bacterium]|jgi:hypothetical protein|nr:hypothetical protein [Kiritimatiellia bacterium]
MKVYAIVVHYMNGSDAVAVFSTLETANKYLERHDDGGSPEIVEKQVQGELEEENKVFIAHSYDKVFDIHNFVGVYFNFEEANKAAGEKGLVLNMIIDGRIG